jgi:hypothetical protein
VEAVVLVRAAVDTAATDTEAKPEQLENPVVPIYVNSFLEQNTILKLAVLLESLALTESPDPTLASGRKSKTAIR